MKRLIKWLLMITIVVVIGLVAILFKPQLIKPQIEHFLSEISGYDISLDGGLNLSLGKTSSVQATHINISNPDYTSQPKLAAIESLQITFETGSLWSKAIVFSEIDMSGAEVTLDTNKSGTSNWETRKKPSSKDNAAKQDKTINIKNIQVRNSQLRYHQHAVGRDQLVKIASLIQTDSKDGLLNIALDATFNDRPTTFNGHIGTFANIIKGRDVSFDGKGQFGPIKISGKGLIDNLVHPRQPEFDIKMIGPDINDVTAMLKIDDLGEGPFDLEAHGLETNGKYSATVEGKIGNITLNASTLSHQAGNFNNLDVKLDANGPNLGALAKAFGKTGWPHQSFNLHGDIQRKNSILDISQLKLDIGGANFLLNAKLNNFPSLDPSEISLSVKGDEVAHFRELLGIKEGVATGAFSLKGDLGLSDDNVKQLTVNFESSLGKTLVTGNLGPTPAYNNTRLHLKVNGHNARLLMSIFNISMLPAEPFTLESDMQFGKKGKNDFRHFTLDNLEIDLADVSLTGNVAFDARKPLSTGRGTLRLSSQDIANLKRFPFLEKTIELIVPGQSFHLAGDLILADRNWQLKGLNGVVGDSTLAVNGILKPSQKWANSNIGFDVKGRGLQLLLENIGPSSHLQEAFTSSGVLQVTNNNLQLNGFKFNSGSAQATVAGSMAWPVTSDGDIDFEIVSQGDDISRFIPAIGKFKPGKIAFSLKTSGKRQQTQIHFDNLTATAGSLRITLNGLLNEKNKQDSNASFLLESRNIGDLGHYDGKPLPKTSLMVQADMHGTPDHFKLDQLQAKLGKNDLSGTLEVLLGGSIPRFVLDSNSDLLDFSAVQSSLQASTKTTPESSSNPRRLIPDTPLPLSLLSQFDASINAKVKQLRLRHDSLTNISLESSVKDGSLDIPNLTFDGQRGNVSVALTMSPTEADKAKVTIDARAEGLVLNSDDQVDFHADDVPAMDILMTAHGEGSNLQQLAASVNGTIKAGSKGGILAGVNLGVLDNFVLDQIFSLILPKSKQKDNTRLTCAAAVLELENGVATTNPVITFTTNKITLVSKGTLDLSTERLSFGFRATPNGLLKVSTGEILNSFIVVGGTLSKPEVGLDPAKVLLQGGAAIGTAGISLLAKGLLDRFGNKVPVCKSMLEQLEQDKKLSNHPGRP